MRWALFLVGAVAWGQSSASIQAQLASVERQREAVRRQGTVAASAERGCEALSDREAAGMIESAAKAVEVPVRLVRAVIAQESGFKPCAVSKKGAKGLMQLMPGTAEQFAVAEPFDAEANVAAGTQYLRQLLEKYKGDLRLALAAYNAGPAAVDAAGGVPEIRETRDYVEAIVGVMGVKQIDLPNIPTPKPIGN
jgi:soluble lytic murein transglycosylase-like protein